MYMYTVHAHMFRATVYQASLKMSHQFNTPGGSSGGSQLVQLSLLTNLTLENTNLINTEIIDTSIMRFNHTHLYIIL